ncbi:MAG TPA: polysaccharide biosynthesis/export family protein [Thermoguttaceae bacterium]|nr:polysaccharide biosynthesis/export family protein [Thermoguttaceae bacterium]
MPIPGSYRPCIAAVALMIPLLAGCTTYWHSVPAYGPNFLDAPRASQETINFIRLRQDPPKEYLLAQGDILGIFIQGVVGGVEEVPAVQLSTQEKVPPAIGAPVPVQDDGTIALPFVPPIQVDGLTLIEVGQKIRKAYTVDEQILPPGEDRIIVTLMKARIYRVLVVREDRTGSGWSGSGASGMYGGGYGNRQNLGLDVQRRGMTYSVELPAYQNDVLHALAEAGGLPGLDAKNEIRILRGSFKDATEMDRLKRGFDNHATRDGVLDELLEDNPFETLIPLRTGPGEPLVEFDQEDIILQEGDIVFIESNEGDVFYTGGLLPGYQFPIPRDYDLDILGAIALAGGHVAFTPVSGGYSGSGGGALFPPTRAIVLRKVDGCQQAIRVDLKKALCDPTQRIVIQPHDFIVLEYKPHEVILNYLFDKYDYGMDGLVARVSTE